MKNKKKLIFVMILQTILAYFLAIYIPNDSIQVAYLLKLDIWLFLLIWIALFYVFSHFIFPIKKIYETIYEKRYYIALILLLIIVLGKFNGSSYGLWNNIVEPKYDVEELSPIIGHSRPIRSDEWLVNTTFALSQTKTGYKYFNNAERGTKTDVFSTVGAPVASLITLVRPFSIGFIFFGADYGESLYWFGRLFALFLVTFELLMVFTKGKKLLSLAGTMLITFSPAVFWWYSVSLLEMIVGGEFTILMFYHFLKTDSMKKKILYSVLIAFGFLVYAFSLYPAWMIPFGYFYLLLAVYFFITLRKEHKFKIKNFLPLLISIGIIIVFVVAFLKNSAETYKILMSTAYPGNRFSVGGANYENLFVYPISILFSYFGIETSSNICEMSTFYSLFPLTFILAIYYLIKDRKNWKENGLIISICGLMTVYLIFAFFSFPKILSRITLLYMVPPSRLTVIISFLSVILLILLVDKLYFKTTKEKIILLGFIVISTVITTYIASKVINMRLLNWALSFGILLIVSGTLLLEKKRTVVFCIAVSFVSLFATIYINPVMKGITGLDKKPISKELEKYKSENAKWIALDSYVIPNYLSSRGIKTINSTNVYPNLKLWKKLDKNGKYEDMYNRYAHIDIKLSQEKTKFKLIQPDILEVKLNTQDLCKLNVGYITTSEQVDEYENNKVDFDKEYHKDNLYIYKVNCLGG